MTEPGVEIPRRALFKASEVCEIARVQPYVLRSWEVEFPRLGIAKTPGGPRVYRRSDVERVLQIKQLVYSEGLTLSGARRRIEGTETAEPAELTLADLLDDDTRGRLAEVKQGLRSLLDMLSAGQPELFPVPAPPPLKETKAGSGEVADTDRSREPSASSRPRGTQRPPAARLRKAASARK